MSISRYIRPKEATHIPEPPIAKFLFADTRMAWFWLIVRLYVGYEWLTAGLDKLTGYSFTFDSSFGTKVGNPWVFGAHDGAAMAGFAKNALTLATGQHPAVQSWYASFLQNVVVPNSVIFSYMVTFGEVLVGLGLIFGALTGIAAFFGVFMNLNFMLAGAVSINPVLGMLALLLVLAWRVAGYYGIDSVLLPLLGTPWTGRLVGKKAMVKSPAPAAS
ncbi:MAG TPA: DoxX family protein [Ktedonobacteraceae bacterium]|jgi:thiosulfate dehydrogenase (quinone) large subunit|nr:DoxX family protein [Ktedonobacteraceae bacterium]